MREGDNHNAKALAYLKRAGYGGEPSAPVGSSGRRGGPVDIELEVAGSPSTRDTCTHDEADADYFGGLKKFERHDNMAAEPTRGLSNEPVEKASRHRK